MRKPTLPMFDEVQNTAAVSILAYLIFGENAVRIPYVPQVQPPIKAEF